MLLSLAVGNVSVCSSRVSLSMYASSLSFSVSPEHKCFGSGLLKQDQRTQTQDNDLGQWVKVLEVDMVGIEDRASRRIQYTEDLAPFF
jgi:hypothetical protein